ncbi:leucine-rich repeat domain-containing protein [Noviherbaspirillum agri]
MIPTYLNKSPIPYAQNLADVPRSATDLAINGTTKSLHLLKEWPVIERLWVLGVNQREWDAIAPAVNPRMLMVYQMRVADLSLLGAMSRLEELCLNWNTKAISLSGIEHLQGLKTLAIYDFPKLQALEPLSALSALKVLDLQGGMWNPLKLDSLEPLGMLKGLEQLRLVNLKVADGGLKALCKLRGLRKLVLSNQFPTEAYAQLSVCLPHVDCAMFQPYITLGSPVGGKDVMVVGRGKPFLNSVEDAARLRKYCAEFEAHQAACRAQQGDGAATT